MRFNHWARWIIKKLNESGRDFSVKIVVSRGKMILRLQFVDDDDMPHIKDLFDLIVEVHPENATDHFWQYEEEAKQVDLHPFSGEIEFE